MSCAPNLMHTLELTFGHEADLALSRLEDKIAPYIEEVRADQKKIAEDALGQRQGSVIVMKPSTGEVLALVTIPIMIPGSFFRQCRC